MQDLDKQLEGMKQDLTGLQVWNPDSTSYYQADGADPYAYADGKHKADSFFNADGDVADLQKKIDGLNVSIRNLGLESSKAIKRIAELDRIISGITLKSKKKPWQTEQEALRVRVNSGIPNEIASLQAKIVEYQTAQEKWRENELAKVSEGAKSASRSELAKQGLTPEAIEAKLIAEGKASGRNKMLLIAGSLILIAGFGFIFLRRRNG
jgi:hypothetical protein